MTPGWARSRARPASRTSSLRPRGRCGSRGPPASVPPSAGPTQYKSLHVMSTATRSSAHVYGAGGSPAYDMCHVPALSTVSCTVCMCGHVAKCAALAKCTCKVRRREAEPAVLAGWIRTADAVQACKVTARNRPRRRGQGGRAALQGRGPPWAARTTWTTWTRTARPTAL